MGFKEDADFARYVSMGAVATDAVRKHLRVVHGHEAIELERYAMANKIWQTKVKRLRLPDLLCVRCGRRVESKGKSQLGVVLSHSEAPDRAWDDGGMRDDDLFAFVRVDVSTDPPTVSNPIYFRTADLRLMRPHAKESNRKAISEGSEMTLTWTGWIPNKSGRVVEVDEEGRILCEWDGGATYRYHQWSKWPQRHLYLEPGAAIVRSETMVAGIVSPVGHLDCPGDTWDLAVAIDFGDEADRYAATRTAGVLGRNDLIDVLAHIADDGVEDWRIRLEALASLARLEPAVWTHRVAQVALDAALTEPHRIESVFVLSEIPTDEAAEALAEVASDPSRPQELRAAALWGLGQGVNPRADLLLPFTVDGEDFVALHAIAGLPSLPDELIPTLVGWLAEADDRRAAVAAQILLRHQAIGPLIEAVRRGDSGRLWALRALGDLPPELVREVGGELLTPDIEDDLAPLWIGQQDWLRIVGAEGLEALDVQKVRFNPIAL